MEYLNMPLAELEKQNQSALNKIIKELEIAFFESVEKKSEKLDGIKFSRFLRKTNEQLFKLIKHLKENDKKETNHHILLKSYNNSYKSLEIEYKKDFPNAFIDQYEFWSLKDYQSPFLNNSKYYSISQFNSSKKTEQDLNDNDRQEILEFFLVDQNAIKKYHQYEKKLIARGFISNERNEWKKPLINFIRYIHYCAERKLLKSFYRGDDFIDAVKGMKVLYFYNKTLPSDYEKLKVAKDNIEKEPNKFDFLN